MISARTRRAYARPAALLAALAVGAVAGTPAARAAGIVTAELAPCRWHQVETTTALVSNP